MQYYGQDNTWAIIFKLEKHPESAGSGLHLLVGRFFHGFLRFRNLFLLYYLLRSLLF
jgi:hypothetical protein